MRSTERRAALFLVVLLLGASLEFIAMVPAFRDIAVTILVQQQALLCCEQSM
jgi:hypothetical protein